MVLLIFLSTFSTWRIDWFVCAIRRLGLVSPPWGRGDSVLFPCAALWGRTDKRSDDHERTKDDPLSRRAAEGCGRPDFFRRDGSFRQPEVGSRGSRFAWARELFSRGRGPAFGLLSVSPFRPGQNCGILFLSDAVSAPPGQEGRVKKGEAFLCETTGTGALPRRPRPTG